MVNTAIIYQSKYGSTEKYAKWLYEEIGGDLYKKSDVSINDLKKYDTIIYGGGLYITGIAGFSFIKNNYKYLEDKKIIVFAVGASPFDTGIIFEIKGNNFPNEMKYIPCFYFRGAFDDRKIKSGDKILILLLKKLISKKNELDYEDWEKAFIESTEDSQDWTCKEYLKPLVEYINQNYKE
ncbi:flavodoxin [Romboutsia ilealis]|uniref:Flavodoxin n=1 Tax=Romboutsia faecis TaxID=2764597 RepID=A0ABR7JSJ7_9FIRM|nr:flavodoxin domain-containing protein [Romboutsia faecis]MBC5997902.1 flavodoxin [Romboutsia faecis]MRN25597.1 flavodoxin [Romboutsia ilealis]